MREESSRTHDVFLSHSSQDKTWADAACAVLERQRIRCWIAPRDITPGDEWGAAIMKGLNGSRIMVLIFSGHANASEQVRREVERAGSQGMIILPFRVEDVRPEGAMEFTLSNRHWLDAFTPPVERKLELLARSVKTLLANEVEPVGGTGSAKPAEKGGNPAVATEARRARTFWLIAIASSLFGLVALGVIIITIKTKITVPDVSSIPVDRDGKIVEHAPSKSGTASIDKPTGGSPEAKPRTPPAAPKRIPPPGPARLATRVRGPRGPSRATSSSQEAAVSSSATGAGPTTT